MNPDGLEMFISILKRLDFTYFKLVFFLDMPIMTCPSRGTIEAVIVTLAILHREK